MILRRTAFGIGVFAIGVALAGAPSTVGALPQCDEDHQRFWRGKVQEDKDGIARAQADIQRFEIASANFFLEKGRINPDFDAALRTARQSLADWKKIAAKDSLGYEQCMGYKPIALIEEPRSGTPGAKRATPSPRTPPPERSREDPGTVVALRFRSSDTSDTLTLKAPADFRWLSVSAAQWVGTFSFSMSCPVRTVANAATYTYDCDAKIAGNSASAGNVRGGGPVHVTLYPAKHPMQLVFDAGTFTVTDYSRNPPEVNQVHGARSVWNQE